MQWRYIATRLNGDGTETVLDYDVPLSRVKITDQLSGPGGIIGVIPFEVAHLRGPDGHPLFLPWSTAIYAEFGGIIRAGGILVEMEEQGSALGLDCIGFSGYPNEMPYTDYETWTGADPLTIVRHIWSNLQGKPRGNIGVEVDGKTSTPRRVGTPKVENDSNSGPYTLAWYETTDLGREIDELARETPFDYRMVHGWVDETETDIYHRLQFGYPSIGRRRHDLRFVVGENVAALPDVEWDGGNFASEVMVLGAGEGRDMIRGVDKRSHTRIRRAAVVTDKMQRSKSRADAVAREELAARMGDADITELVVFDHPHAQLGSIQLGDEILVQTAEGWSDEFALWVRVLQIEFDPEKDQSVLTITRVEKVSK